MKRRAVVIAGGACKNSGEEPQAVLHPDFIAGGFKSCTRRLSKACCALTSSSQRVDQISEQPSSSKLKPAVNTDCNGRDYQLHSLQYIQYWFVQRSHIQLNLASGGCPWRCQAMQSTLDLSPRYMQSGRVKCPARNSTDLSSSP